MLLPGHPANLVPGTFARLPLELPALVLLLLFARGSALSGLRAAALALLGALLVLRLLDLGSFVAFDRRFSPLVEMHLLGDGWNLASGAIGRLEAGLGIGAGLALIALACAALHRATGTIARSAGAARRVLAVGAGAALAAGALGLVVARAGGPDAAARLASRLASADVAPEVVERVGHMARSIADQQAFVAALDVDPVGTGPDAPSFAALAGRDVGVVFVEAYGRSALELERFSTRTRATLADVGARLDAAGLHAASGWLTSPIRGGRSWLAQATFASGLTVDDQARFDRLLGSDRRPLSALFEAAGWRTAAMMPAIVEAWPEAGWYGFDRVLDGHTSGYAGEPFGWVTMPDQYTLSAFEHRVRNVERDVEGDVEDAPLMGTVALISTHAPWTPVARVVPWEDVGDGSLFDGSLRFGDPVTWTDRESVRDMYAESVDYTLEVIGRYLETYAKDGFFVVLGDHQPASIVDGWGRTADVPIHVVTDDPALLARLPGDAFVPGMVPDDDSTRLPMSAARELLATRFEAEPVVDVGAPEADIGTGAGAGAAPTSPTP